MASKFRLVQGDTLPSLVVQITDKNTGDPVDLSGSTIVGKFRAVGDTVVKATLTCDLLTGFTDEDGEVSYVAPYDATPGKGGRVQINWPADALDTAGEFEAELEVTFANNKVQTAYELLKFSIRPQF